MGTKIRHAFESDLPQGVDPDTVGPDHWNADHLYLGTDTDDDAAAGEIGEYLESVFYAVAAGTSGAYSDTATKAFTKGDWDVTGVLVLAAGTGVTGLEFGLSKGAADNAFDDIVFGSNYIIPTPSGLSTQCFCIANWRAKLAVDKTLRLKTKLTYSGSPLLFGRLSGRRVR